MLRCSRSSLDKPDPDGSGCHSSTELITLDSDISANGPELPMKLSFSCAVKYNDSHIYLIAGGCDYSSNVNKVWIYNLYEGSNSSWTEGPILKDARRAHGCTVIHHEQTSWIVVAGGYETGWERLQSVEVLDPNKNEWINGENTKYILF